MVYRRRIGVSPLKEKAVRLSFLPPRSLRTLERAPRKDQSLRWLCASIERFGFLLPVLCDPDLKILDGQMRVQAASFLKMDKIPVPICIHPRPQKCFELPYIDTHQPFYLPD